MGFFYYVTHVFNIRHFNKMPKRHNDLKLSTAVDNLFVSFGTQSLFIACELPVGSLECIHREKQKDAAFLAWVLSAISF